MARRDELMAQILLALSPEATQTRLAELNAAADKLEKASKDEYFAVRASLRKREERVAAREQKLAEKVDEFAAMTKDFVAATQA